MANLVSEGRQTEIDAFQSIALGLAVQRLMLAVLLEQDHRQKAGPGPAAGHDVEWGWGLRDRLAIPAGDLLPDMLDHFPGPRDHLEGLGDVLAQLRELRASAAGAGRRRRVQDALTRQVLRKWLAGGLLAGEGRDLGGFSCRHLGEEIVFRCAGLDLFELQLELVDEAGRSLGGLAVLFALQLGDLELEMRDECLVVGDLGASDSGVGDSCGGVRHCQIPFGFGGENARLQSLNVIGKLSTHGRDRSTKIHV